MELKPPKGNGRYSKEELKEMFPNTFSGKLGCVKGVKVHLELDPSVRPVRQKLRPIPFHLREAVSAEIKKQIELGILERVTDDMGPTPWVANLVPVIKDREIRKARNAKVGPSRLVGPNTFAPVEHLGPIDVRITVDNRCQNKAILRTRYPTRTIDDLIYEVNGSTVFSTLDIIKAFHQFELEESQMNLTCVNTHEGLLRYRRLHMGISCASEIFTEQIRVMLQDIPGALNMTDDILIHGKDEEDHQRALLAVLRRLEEKGLTLNLEKCQLYKKEVTFFGLRFSADGIAPTEDRVKALREAEIPTDAKALHSFLCTVLWSARFMKDVCTVAEPLWRLTKKDVPWEWGEKEQKAFDALKNLITAKCMSYFRKDWETELITDASPVGLGAVLCQYNPKNPEERHIVCFMSRMLTDVERRYSQCEKEALAVVWACERAQIYLLGHHFTIVTDNRAVCLIYGNASSRPPARIERWALRLTQFDYAIVHRPGNSNIADYYSRSPCGAGVSAYLEEIATERHINYVVRSSLPPAVTIEEVAEATHLDNDLSQLRKLITSGAKHLPKQLNMYKSMVNEISVTREGILLRGHRILIPKALRARVIDLAHAGHQGIVKTKKLIRSRVWFEGIDHAVETKVKKCKECQATTDKPSFEPLKPSKMPEAPWHTVAGDFYGPMEDGTYWFVNICEHSQWASVDKVRKTDEEHTEKVLERLFSTFGAPVVYKSDNGSPFQSYRFAEFAKRWGFKHRRVTPEWPRANGKAESFMKKLGKVLRTSKLSGLHKEQGLNDFLKAYRETPHSTTGVAPNHLMFGFSRSSGIPSMLPETPSQREKWRQEALANDARAKKRMKEEYDARMKAKESRITVGAKVVIKIKKTRKSDWSWDVDRPYEVVAMKGSMVTASRNGHTTTRNSSFFKLHRGSWDDQDEPSSTPERREEATPVNATIPPPPQAIRPDEQPNPIRSNAPTVTANGEIRKPGRPTVEQSREIEQRRQAEWNARREANPPTRSSNRLRNRASPSNASPSNASPSNTSPSNEASRDVNRLSKKGGKMWCPREHHNNNNNNNNNNKT